MEIKIALAGNPNCGKTTLFNALTGSNQYVGNWPGVTVEKKEGNLKKHEGVIITDLPGIYSLSPYTMEEVVARNYLIGERPNAILNMIDGTNLERNLYLTTQLMELGIPVVVAINMMDVVRKNGDEIRTEDLSRKLGCPVLEISALKEEGVIEAAEAAIEASKAVVFMPKHRFSGTVEHALAHIEEAAVHDYPEERQRWYAVKIFERDKKVLEELQLPEKTLRHIEKDIKTAEQELDDDAEAIITNERYNYVEAVVKACCKKKHEGELSISDKIDKVVTSRWLGLPVFAVIMFLVYYVAMVVVGSTATNWANDGLFGNGFHLFGIGTSDYEEAVEAYGDTDEILSGFIAVYGDESMAEALDTDSDTYKAAAAEDAIRTLLAATPEDARITYELTDKETLEVTQVTNTGKATLEKAAEAYLDGCNKKFAYGKPHPEDYAIWVPGIPVLVERGLDALNAADWLKGLILDGIVAGVGAVLGFVPQMLVLFLMLAFLEACGYMARIAFVLDKLFRKIGLSGKSFIPMLIGTGCSVPGIMASRTIENEPDRRMTIMTTSFIPCGAKVPFIAMIAGAIFGGSAWVSTSAYFVGMLAVIFSGLILKKTKMFAGEPAPFVMELPPYHMPPLSNVLRSMWERGWSFIKKAGTIILVFTVLVWFATRFGFVNDAFCMLNEDELDHSILAAIGSVVAWIFKPLGWGTWQAAVATLTGLVAKENIVSTMGVFYGSSGNLYDTLSGVFTGITAYSFMLFNLLCAPCVAAMGAIKREMNNGKWTAFAIGYQCVFAYAVAFMVTQFGGLFTGDYNIAGIICAAAVLVVLVGLLMKPEKKKLT